MRLPRLAGKFNKLLHIVSMTILHTADWHLGHLLYNYSREEEQLSFLQQIVAAVRLRQPDVFILAGDVYNTDNPSVDTMRMFTNAVLDLRDAAPAMTIVITAGNHDSYRRLEVNNALWERHGVCIVGVIARGDDGLADLDRHIIPARNKDGDVVGYVLAVPHAFPQNFPLTENSDCDRNARPAAFFQALSRRVEQINTAKLPVVLTAHLAVGGSDFTGHDEFVGFQDSFSTDVLGCGFDYAALGHIHKPQTVDGVRIRYSGTPVAVSFDETYEHSLSFVSISGKNTVPQIETIEIKNIHPLITIPASEYISVDEALALLADYPSDKEAYIRLNILPSELSVAEISNKAVILCKDKKCRFCTVNVQRAKTQESAGKSERFSVEDLKKLSPVEVAAMYYKERIGEEMPVEQKKDLSDLYLQIPQSGGNNVCGE